MAGLEPGAAPGAMDPGGAAPGLAFGLTAPGDSAALGGAGGAPLAPGTGRALVLGKGWVEGSVPGALTGCGAFGLPACPAPGKPALAAGLIVALGGIGALPCWISAARCTTACGTAAPAGLARPAIAGARLPGPGPAAAPAPTAGAAAGGRLMTVLMTVVLWMFW